MKYVVEESKDLIPDWAYKIWPLVPLCIAVGFFFFTEYKRTIPSLLTTYAIVIVIARIVKKLR